MKKLQLIEIIKEEVTKILQEKEKDIKKALFQYKKIFLYINGLQCEGDEYYKYSNKSNMINND